MQIDHLMIGAADLETAMEDAERRFGRRPVPGGAHPGRGTRNALLGLEQGRYLEWIVPDPAQALDGTFGAELARLPAPALVTFAVESRDLDAVAALLRRHGYGARGPVPTRRATPGGETLSWALLFPRDHPFGSLCPFFIDWQDSRHPSADLPQVGRLESLELGCSQPAPLAALCEALSLAVDVVQAPQPSLRARLAGEGGGVLLESSPGTVALRFG